MVRGVLIAGVVSLAVCASAGAATVRVEVRTPNGKPVENAVVTISGPAEKGSPPAEGFVIEQKDLAFHPFVLVIPRGASVSFPNLDQTRHHVYSFSPAGPFELKLYGFGETRSVRFDNLGVIALGCNIHDQMSAFIRVTDSPWAAVTNSSGLAIIDEVERGERTIEIWHPYLKNGQGAALKRQVSIPADAGSQQVFEVAIRKPLDMHAAY